MKELKFLIKCQDPPLTFILQKLDGLEARMLLHQFYTKYIKSVSDRLKEERDPPIPLL